MKPVRRGLPARAAMFWGLLVAVLCLGMAGRAAVAATRIDAAFRAATPDAGWQLSGSATVTGDGVDAVGKGVLRLTGRVPFASGTAVNTATLLRANRGVALTFSYAAWGGGEAGEPGGDGLAVFLFNASDRMRGALSGGALGYCGGAGGFFALGLDAYGNFSTPAACPGTPGAGRRPQALVIRGPVAAGNPLVEGLQLRDKRLDSVGVSQRPGMRQVRVLLRPQALPLGTYRVDVDMEAEPGGGLQRVLQAVNFPYQAVSEFLGVGFAASTGAAVNVHEVRDVVVRELDDAGLDIRLEFSSPSVAAGATAQLVVDIGRESANAVELTDPVSVHLDAGLQVASPTQLGGTCLGSMAVFQNRRGLRIDKDLKLRQSRCTITAVVEAGAGDGSRAAWIEPRSILTDQGSNAREVQRVLVVGQPVVKPRMAGAAKIESVR